METDRIEIAHELVLVDPRTTPWTQRRIEPGQYDVCRAPNPAGLGIDWLFLVGESYGTAEIWWREAANSDRSD